MKGLEGNSFKIKKKILTLMGAKFSVLDSEENLVLFAKQKAFKFKEDIRLYTDESMEEEVLSIKARSVIDFSATYDVVDVKTGENVGALQRKGLKSMFKDEWVVLGKGGEELGLIKEDNRMMAMLRRMVMNLIPQKFTVFFGEKEVGSYGQHFNPFVFTMDIEFMGSEYDKRLGLAASVLLAAIEGRQQ